MKKRLISSLIAALLLSHPLMINAKEKAGGYSGNGKGKGPEKRLTLDTDGDYLTDRLESSVGLDSNNFADAWQDLDADGYNNQWEVTQTSDHTNPLATPFKRYPSTKTAMVIPGYQQDPAADVNPNIQTAADVEAWEYAHFDLGAGMGVAPSDVPGFSGIGYMYHQADDYDDANGRINELRDYLALQGVAYEDLFLHFAEDTTFSVLHADHGSKSGLAGYFNYVYFTYNDTDIKRGLNRHYLNRDLWMGRENGGAAFVGQPTPFDEINITLNTPISDGVLSAFYVSGLDGDGAAIWTYLPLLSDTTSGLKQDGKLRFAPPSDWFRTAIDGNADNAAYFIKLTLNATESPNVAAMQSKDLRGLNADASTATVKGWDAANDRNGDGYVDDDEFASRVNPAASARLRHEARVYPVGNMWSVNSSYAYLDLTNPGVRAALAQRSADTFARYNHVGAYNDSYTSTINGFEVQAGGAVSELDGLIVDSDDAHQLWYDAFVQTLRDVKSVSGARYIAANISYVNPYQDAIGQQTAEVMDLWVREGYLVPAMGLDGYFGLQKMWPMRVATAAGQDTIVMSHVKWSRVHTLGNTQVHWEADLESSLAVYYLISDPEHTFFTAWNASYQYGSGNTWVSPDSYYRAGVPRNYAYQPHGLLSVDIGEPANSMPEGAEPLRYTAVALPSETLPWGENYLPVGDTTSTTLEHPEFANGALNVKPTYVYFAYRSADWMVNEISANDGVLARDFTQGKVLFYANFHRGRADFMAAQSPVIDLGDWYHRVHFDGSLSAPINQIQLQGYEGAILLKAKPLVE